MGGSLRKKKMNHKDTKSTKSDRPRIFVCVVPLMFTLFRYRSEIAELKRRCRLATYFVLIDVNPWICG